MPLDLIALQADFRTNALAHAGVDGAPPHPPTPLVAAIRADGIPAASRLNIHRNHYAVTLTDALAGIYGATRALVGAAYFDSLALRYARAHPPVSPCLFEYGAGLARALADGPGMAEHAYAIDVARLEWAMHESLHAPAAAALTPGRMAAVPEGDLPNVRLTPHPTLRLLRAPFPVHRLWQGVQAGDVGPNLLSGQAACLALWRPGFDVLLEAMDAPTFRTWTRLAASLPLGDVAAAAADEGDADWSQGLGLGLRLGLFAE